jgi:hypothetical protein
MPFDATITAEEALAARRLAILHPAPLKPLPPIDHEAIKRRADELYAQGFGKAQAYAGLGDAIALAGRLGRR